MAVNIRRPFKKNGHSNNKSSFIERYTAILKQSLESEKMNYVSKLVFSNGFQSFKPKIVSSTSYMDSQPNNINFSTIATYPGEQLDPGLKDCIIAIYISFLFQESEYKLSDIKIYYNVILGPFSKMIQESNYLPENCQEYSKYLNFDVINIEITNEEESFNFKEPTMQENNEQNNPNVNVEQQNDNQQPEPAKLDEADSTAKVAETAEAEDKSNKEEKKGFFNRFFKREKETEVAKDEQILQGLESSIQLLKTVTQLRNSRSCIPV